MKHACDTQMARRVMRGHKLYSVQALLHDYFDTEALTLRFRSI